MFIFESFDILSDRLVSLFVNPLFQLFGLAFIISFVVAFIVTYLHFRKS